MNTQLRPMGFLVAVLSAVIFGLAEQAEAQSGQTQAAASYPVLRPGDILRVNVFGVTAKHVLEIVRTVSTLLLIGDRFFPCQGAPALTSLGPGSDDVCGTVIRPDPGVPARSRTRL